MSIAANSIPWFVASGYLLTVAIELPVLTVGLSPKHRWQARLAAGFWLSACTYPIVTLALPALVGGADSLWRYYLVAETFAPLAECALFCAAFSASASTSRRERTRDCLTIVGANLLSFGLGEWLRTWGIF